jgi:serine/threonine-protein kinase RsbW
MHKDEVNSDQVTARVDDSPQPASSDISGSYDPTDFDSHTADKSERIRLDALLPFLEERIAFKMPSDLRHLDGVLDYLNERMLRLGIVNSDDSEVLIALDEAIVNAIKHGNKCDPRKAVHIVAEFSADGVRFIVADEGAGFELEKVPDPTEPCRLLEPSGRGLLLINHIMDEVRFNQCGNRLEMFKRPVNKPQSRLQSTNGQNTSE